MDWAHSVVPRPPDRAMSGPEHVSPESPHLLCPGHEAGLRPRPLLPPKDSWPGAESRPRGEGLGRPVLLPGPLLLLLLFTLPGQPGGCVFKVAALQGDPESLKLCGPPVRGPMQDSGEQEINLSGLMTEIRGNTPLTWDPSP